MEINYREYIEHLVFNRLTRHGLYPVPDTLYIEVSTRLDKFIRWKANQFTIPGIDPEALVLFMQLKVYQMLSQGQWDPKRGSFVIFKQSLTNLLTDISRIAKRLRNRQVLPDAETLSYEFLEAFDRADDKNYPWSDLSDEDLEIIDLCLSFLEENDEVLIPEVREILIKRGVLLSNDASNRP